LSGLSFCIDPGHGAGNSNQGPTGLREADINLSVSLFLKEFLKSANIDTVLLTRVSDATNPTLSQREAVANNFGVDWFHSVHHNACGGAGATCTARSTIVLIEEVRSFANPCPSGRARGTGQPEWPGLSDTMSDFMGTQISRGLRTTSAKTWLDWTFYGGCNGGFSLGVLNDLLMPGELSEATFHQTRIEEDKLRNPDFLKLEARALFMAILDFYEAGTMATGALSGIIRDDETKQPLNGVTVTLNPGGQQYTTDGNNNGLFVFHDLQPGMYQITVMAHDYVVQQRSRAVTAHAFTHADFSMVLDVPPVVMQTLPNNESEDVDVYNEVGLRFNRPMDRESVEAAFSITPPTAGHFLWSPRNDVLLFEPDTRFAFETAHTVTIAATATDTTGNALDGNGDGIEGDPFSFKFTTQALDNTKPVVMDFFPTQRDTGVFVRDVLTATFNQELDPQSINAGTVLLTGDGSLTPAVKLFYLTDGSKELNIVPVEPLQAGRRYFVTLTSGISLPDGTTLGGNFVWQFTAQSTNIQVSFLDDFEGPFNWKAPQDAQASRGFEPDSTIFELTRSAALSGIQAERLQYAFTAPDGLLELDMQTPASLDLSKIMRLGYYVFGDGSGNSLRFLFADSDGVEASAPYPVTWHGWRLLFFDFLNPALSTDGVSGNGLFDAGTVDFLGFQLHHTGNSTGVLTLDDLITVQPDVTVSVETPAQQTGRPENFVLQQNYPNPFNPETAIRYDIPEATHVKLAIYNLQGQRIRTLVNTFQQPGSYRVLWNGKDERHHTVSNGIYVYTIRLKNRTESRRMIFLK